MGLQSFSTYPKNKLTKWAKMIKFIILLIFVLLPGMD
jgi:hypothetical protein